MTPRARAVLFLVCGAQFMVILDVSIVNVALEAIRVELDMSEAGLQWIVNAYAIAFGGFLLLGGRAADLLGRRRVFVAGLTLFTGASLVGGLAQSPEMLIAARAVQGLGGAIVAPTTLSILTTAFAEGPERTRAMGAWGAVAGLGGSAGAIVGGVLTDALDWRWILFVNVPIGAVLIAQALRRLPADQVDPAAERSFDVAGATTATLGLVAVVFGIVRTEVVGWGSGQSLGPLLGGVVLLAAFLVVEGRIARRPLMPLRVLRSPALAVPSGAMVLLSAGLFAMWFFVTLYLQQVLGYSPLEAGVAFLPLTVLMGLGSFNAGRVVAAIGPRRTLLVGFGLAALGFLLFSRISADGSFVADVLPASIVTAVGVGLCFVPLTALAVAGSRPDEAGLVSGIFNVSRQVGGALGLAILTTIAATRTGDLLPAGAGEPRGGGAVPDAVAEALTAGYSRAFVVATGFAIAGWLVVALLLRARPAAGGPVLAAAPAPADGARGAGRRLTGTRGGPSAVGRGDAARVARNGVPVLGNSSRLGRDPGPG
ncbi:MFS transporter [Patulibacter brassicae]|uniref:MFS transporter n=1 Tax=Patulibacter brassicae TaxID=1705717 RepID=A0ABU4VEK0_9ACTN|nr:MFS transporter [Patulibacter brassicae]MDX8150221.1 MFS transporter [Patulibacter brassicae]